MNQLQQENQVLQMDIAEALSREQSLLTRSGALEKEVLFLENELSSIKAKEAEIVRELNSADAQITYLERELETSMRVKNQLRSNIIDAIDQNDRFGQKTGEIPPLN